VDGPEGIQLSATVVGTWKKLIDTDDRLVASDLLLLDGVGATLARLPFEPIQLGNPIREHTPVRALTATLSSVDASSIGDVRIELVYRGARHDGPTERFGWSMIAPGLESEPPFTLEEREHWTPLRILFRGIRRRAGI
jgi:hypothetical protein